MSTMSAQQNHYETLGLPASATQEEIKKRYRELARRFHPDVNSTTEAADKIRSINDAYQVLGDPDRRAAYDSERILRQVVARQTHLRESQPNRPTPDPKTQPQESKVEYNGFGRTYRETPATEPVRTGPTTVTRRSREQISTEASQMLADAKLAFINRQYRKAETLCLQVLKDNQSCSSAHEIIGDINVYRGEMERATTAFTYAVQFDPWNVTAQKKLEKITGPPLTEPINTYQSNRGVRLGLDSPFPPPVLLVVTCLAAAALFGPLLGYMLFPSIAASLNFRHILLTLPPALVSSGIGMGILLAFFGQLNPIRQEIGLKMFLLLSILSVGTLAIALPMCSILQSKRKRSVMGLVKMGLTTILMTLLFAYFYTPGVKGYPLWATTYLSLSLLFPSGFIGWYIGDIFRLRGRL